MVPVALCEYHQQTGWRVRGLSHSDRSSVRVVHIGSLKLLRLPLSHRVPKPGHFTNPRKLIGV